MLNVGIAGFVIGGVAAGAAVAAFLWPVKQRAAPSASVLPAVGPGGSGLVVRGAF